jgi:hypothetical protein
MSARTARKNAGFLRQFLFVVEMAGLLLAARYLTATELVSFDVTPAVVGCPQHDSNLPVLSGYEAVSIQLKISTFVDPRASGTLGQLLYRIRSHQGQSTVLDYAPKTEMLSSYEGPVEMTLSDETTEHLGMKLSSAYESLVRAEVGSDNGRKSGQCAKFRRQAIHDTVVTSGTVDQASGVYFKLNNSFDRTLEGDKIFSILLQLPVGWKNELLNVTLQAWGPSQSHRDPVAEASFPIAVWREGAPQARQTAMELAQSVQYLKELSGQYDRTIQQRAYPSVFHRLGAALEVIDPKIPRNWLNQVFFTEIDPYHDPRISKMPVDVRVGILNYQEARQHVLAHSTGDDSRLVAR